MRFDTIVWREHGKSKELLRARLLKYLLLSVRFLSKKWPRYHFYTIYVNFQILFEGGYYSREGLFLGNTVKINKIKLNQRENCMFLVSRGS